MIILSGRSHPQLAADIATAYGAELGQVDNSQFKNGERRLHIRTNLINQEVAIVQSLSQPVDEHLIELMLLIDAAERAGARQITVILPWMAYSLQDKTFLEGMPISARVVADMISSQYVSDVILLELHNDSVSGFFSVPTRVLSTLPLFADHIGQTHGKDVVVVSPDFGGLKRAHKLAEKLDAPLANIQKHRDLNTGEVEIEAITGADIAGKTCIVLDDVVNSGSTVVEVAEALQKAGAQSSHFYVTHFLYVEDSFQNLMNSPLDSIVITDSIRPSSDAIASPKCTVLTTAHLICSELTALTSS